MVDVIAALGPEAGAKIVAAFAAMLTPVMLLDLGGRWLRRAF